MSTVRRVLIVDDKEENLCYLEALLSAHGWIVETARHGAEGLLKARMSPPDLAISDLLMPVMDGYTFLRHWKADGRLRKAPFVVYTATYTEAQDEKLALDLGADAFILKPAEPEDFLRRVSEVLVHAAREVRAEPKRPEGDDRELLKTYSEALIRKLEEKTLQLQKANEALERDIEVRRATEASLRESEERFRATFEQAAVGIAHLGPEGEFLRVNDRFCGISGYGRGELERMRFHELLPEEDRAEGDRGRLAMLAGESESTTIERPYRRKDGAPVWCSVATRLLRNEAGEPKYFISVVTDITERRRLQEHLLRVQRLESLGALAGGVAHDLNNVLAPLVMGVGLLKPQLADPEQQELIGMMERSAARGAALVKQVLSFARGVETERVPLDPAGPVREIEALARKTFPRSIAFQVEMPPERWPVKGDATQLNQVLMNLCVNARDAMPQGGTLTVRLANVEADDQYVAAQPELRPGRYVLLEVADTGTGLPPELKSRIFEPFVSTKPLGKGTGLGLATVQSIVRSHGGHVTVAASIPGRGATFRVYLPALRPGSGGAGPAAAETGSVPRGHGELVLVVDDEVSVLTMTRHTLETFGYRVLTAEDGAQATAGFAQHREEVAAVVTDMVMPVMDGPALIGALRRIRPQVRVIACSGFSGSGGMRQQAGDADAFLEKPYTAHSLLEALRTVLAR